MAATLDIPYVDFSRVHNRLDRLMDPYKRNSAIAVFGAQGSGKSHLIRHGILNVRPMARTVVFDVKAGHSKVWDGYGKQVDELRPGFHGDGGAPFGNAYHFMVHPDRETGKRQLAKALNQISTEGHCVVVIDESRKVTEREQYGQSSAVENLITTGRESGITVILGAQSSAWAVSSLQDQPGARFIGRVPGREKELSAMAGYGSELIPTLRAIKHRSFLYTDALDENQEPILGITGL